MYFKSIMFRVRKAVRSNRSFMPHETKNPFRQMKKLAIFDLDGTLLDTLADLAGATNYALSQLGYPTHETDAYRTFVGNGINKLFERALPQGEQTEVNVLKMRSLFVPYYDEHNADLSTPYTGIPSVLESLQNEGMKIAVASNKYQAATAKLIAQYFPNISFEAVFGQRTDVPTKPNPAVVEEIINLSGISKEDVVYIGDSSVDMQTGTNAGVATIGVSWGFRPRTELESFHPDFIADTREELLTYLLSH